jgi:hypothetical protein
MFADVRRCLRTRGAKLWRLAYRYGGKQKLLAFGIYPTVSLADARARRDAAKKHLKDGLDPSAHLPDYLSDLSWHRWTAQTDA